MERQPVKSSSIRSIGYDEPTRALHVEFHSGGLYEYRNIGPDSARKFMKAKSKGGHFAEHIKPHREGRKLNPPAEQSEHWSGH